MKIVMLEPLAIPNDIIVNLATPFINKGDHFILCDQYLSEEEKMIRISNADVIITANSPLDAKIIIAAKNLKLISVGFTGIDHIDENACKEKNITVCNAQGYATEATAELTIALMLSVLRNIVFCHEKTMHGGDKKGLVGHEIHGKTVGIIGTGAIGGRVCEILKVLGCKVIGYNRNKNHSKTLEIEYVELEELFKQSDIISLHAPLLDATRNMINKNTINLMKKTAILINCARGPLINLEDLIEALNNDKIAGAGLDVFDIEPPLSVDHLITHAKNLTVTPHVGYASYEAMIKRANIVFENISAWQQGHPQNVKY